MLFNVGSKEAKRYSFSHFNISVSKSPFKPPSDDRILVILLVMDLFFLIFLLFAKRFGIFMAILKDVSMTKFVTMQKVVN